jgi:predicted CXXCH cytochrome family protein
LRYNIKNINNLIVELDDKECCMSNYKTVLFAILVFCGITINTQAAGVHEAVSCLGCHSPHYAVDDKIFAVKNTVMKNPRTKEKLTGMVAEKCLGCHELEEFGGAGIRPIHLHTTHPIGIVPNQAIADVPDNLLKNGKLDCISCHDPHTSNPNFMYLRVNTGQSGENMQYFCAMCHSSKADLKMLGINSANEMKVFSSMNQAKGAGEYLRNKVKAMNETPKYIKPLGKLPKNDIMPNYQNPPSWVYSPEIDLTSELNKVQDDIKKNKTQPRNTAKNSQ